MSKNAASHAADYSSFEGTVLAFAITDDTTNYGSSNDSNHSVARSF